MSNVGRNVRNGLVGGAAVVALVTAAAAPLIGKDEGLRLRPYRDLGNVMTWCWGETHDTLTADGRPKEIYTRTECDVMLTKSVARHAGPILACIPQETPFSAKVAFTRFGYNIGVTNFCQQSAAAKLARSHDWAGACKALMSWDNVKVPAGATWPCAAERRIVTKTGARFCKVPGLTARRVRERCTCESDLNVPVRPECRA